MTLHQDQSRVSRLNRVQGTLSRYTKCSALPAHKSSYFKRCEVLLIKAPPSAFPHLYSPIAVLHGNLHSSCLLAVCYWNLSGVSLRLHFLICYGDPAFSEVFLYALTTKHRSTVGNNKRLDILHHRAPIRTIKTLIRISRSCKNGCQ